MPEHVCDELASRAALRSQTLEEYLRSQLEEMGFADSYHHQQGVDA